MNSLNAVPNLSLLGPSIVAHRYQRGDLDVLGSPSTLIGLRDTPSTMLASRLSTKSELGHKVSNDNRFMIRNGKQPCLVKSTTAINEDAAFIPRLQYFNNFM